MILNLGDFAAGATVYVPVHTFSSDDPTASVTLTGLAVTDIEIYKDGGTTQRASDAGYALLDTDGIDFDGITGLHGFSIDLSDNTDSGFFAAGSTYWVAVAAVTVDAATINFWAAIFTIERTGGMATAIADTEALLVDTEAVLVDSEAIIADTELILTDTEGAGALAAILTDTEASQTAEAAILADTEASQTTEGAILTDTEAAITARATLLVDTEAVLADTEQTQTDAGTIIADTEAILADTNELQTDDYPTTLAAILSDTEASQTAETAILADTEASQTTEAAILADTEAASLTAAAIADAVWEEAIADHSGTSGSTAESLAAASSAGDPWATDVPGSYTGSEAGNVLASIITDSEAIVADSEAILADTEGAGAIAAILTDTEASQVAETALLADTEAAVADTEATQVAQVAILADSEAIRSDTETTLLADTEALLADTESAITERATLLVDTEASQTAETAILADTEAVRATADQLNLGIIYGAAEAGTLSTTQATTGLSGYGDDQLIGRLIIWTSGDAEGEESDITDYAATGGLLTFTALTTAPGAGDTFKIV